jgi:hypothetical protein
LQDALLGHLLLEDLHRLLEAIADLDFDRLAEYGFRLHGDRIPTTLRNGGQALRFPSNGGNLELKYFCKIEP